jgi:hypothetical protein
MNASERQHQIEAARNTVGLPPDNAALCVNYNGYSYYWRYYTIPSSMATQPKKSGRT